MKIKDDIKNLLDERLERYNRVSFIENDPVCIPHLFSKKQDIEISGFFAAVLAWGQRITIVNKGKELMKLMDDSPYSFIQHHSEMDLKGLIHFKHRTFNTTDLLYFISFLKTHYAQNKSLESAFSNYLNPGDENIEAALCGFYNYFCNAIHFPSRTKKHISSPASKSTCKRLNMYLRWMVRNDNAGVDFGIWKKIKPAQLICPLDVHVERVARSLNLLKRKQRDWLAAVELTKNLTKLDPLDPVKYDFALFSMGIVEGSRNAFAGRNIGGF